LQQSGQNSFLIDGWRVSPAEGLIKKEDVIVHLEPKVMEVLVYLASRQGEVVTRDEIERDVWHGALISYDAITSTVIKLRKAFQDDARKPRIIATIPKRGYQLIAAVQYTEDENLIPQNVTDNQQLPQSKIRHWHILLVISLVLGLAMFWYAFPTSIDETSYQQPDTVANSIAVLPFENLSNDPKQDYLADGITEDITTDLSNLSNLLVIASSASNTYKGTQELPQKIGEELNVDYILQGSIRQYGELIRVNVQLIDTATGFNKWGESYERQVTQVFAIQRELTSNIVSFFKLDLTSQEKQRLAHNTTNNLIAYDHFQTGQRLSRKQTKESGEEAIKSYRKAIESDPDYGRAYGALAYSLAFAYRRGWTDAPLETLDHALVMARTGVAMDNTVPQTHWALSYVYLMRQEYEKAKKAALKAIEVAPSYADGYGLLALINNSTGHPQQAIEYVKKGMRLNPYYTWDYLYNLGRAYSDTGRYEEAIEALEKARERNESALPVRLSLAVAYVRAGRQDDAEWEVEQIQMLNPAETLTHTEQSYPMLDRAMKERFLDDLRKAGLPE
jgi:TolB-like protein/DNA-binding winged helix-turn-helix (wHTH) protein/Tfp pilus assembly protein PilF